MRITTYDDKGIKVGEIKNWSQVKIGDKNVTVYQGWQQIYPDPNSTHFINQQGYPNY